MRLIDADKLIEDLVKNRNFYPVLVASAIKNTPTVDAVEVVRCKDCKYSRICRDNKLECDILYPSLSWVENDDYCSYGERKVDK